MNGLSEAERESLARAIDRADDRWQHGIGSGGYDVNGPPLWLVDAPETLAAVGAIVAARLASVEALADEWEAEGESLIKHAHSGRDVHEGSTMVSLADLLRGALGSDAHTEACGATYHGHACTLHVGHTSNHLSRDENVNPVASWHDAHTEQKGTGA